MAWLLDQNLGFRMRQVQQAQLSGFSLAQIGSKHTPEQARVNPFFYGDRRFFAKRSEYQVFCGAMVLKP
jgi:hypothetical protein